MHKKHMKGLQILARPKLPTDDDWYKLIEIRVEMLKPLLPSIELRTLGSLRMIDDYGGTNPLSYYNPQVIVSGGEFGLEMAGIFPGDHSSSSIASIEHTARQEGGRATASTLTLWGLTQDAKWCVIRVFTTSEEKPYKYAERREWFTTAQRVEITLSSVPHVCTVWKRHPKKIWELLNAVVIEWAEHCRAICKVAEGLEDVMRCEETLLKMSSEC